LSIGVLGSLEVSVGDRPIQLTANRLRTLLAALAMSAGRTISMDRLAEMVWSDGLPANSRRSLQNYAARLRTALGGRWIETRPGGFLLRVDADNVDALRFGRILDRAARAQDPDLERELLDEALALSRGEPFEDVASPWLQETEAPRLAERYLVALERRVDLDLDAGRGRDFVAELKRWITRYPLRESLWLRLLMLLDLQGRRAEALERYEELRTRLADDLGVNPNTELQRLYADLLVDPPVMPVTATTPPRPRMIPAEAGAVDRHSVELAALNDVARTGSAAVVLVAGPADAGKTALATHWAHTNADQFTGGQLYLDLRGSRGAPIRPAAALRAFLTALGVSPQDLPSDVFTLARMYRTLTADRRMLVLLDDAQDAEQVRLLLPAGRACMSVITSRCEPSGWTAEGVVRTITLKARTAAAGRAPFSHVDPARYPRPGEYARHPSGTDPESRAFDSLLRLLAEALGLAGPEEAAPDPASRSRPVGATRRFPSHWYDVTVPRQLPADVADFVGRTGELALLDGPADTHPEPVSVVEGMAGAGKTALALHAAHRLASRFPDGQLFVDLYGHSADRAPVRPEAALRLMLRALGVPGEHVPHRGDDRAGLFRSLLADRKVLIVLDDAVDDRQVLPLLPGSGDCHVLITSRCRLDGLDGSRTLVLDVLPPTDAITLFTRVAGPHRVAGSPSHLFQTVNRCGLLPLAIRLAATRLRCHPAWDVAHLLSRLTEPYQRLTELAAGNRSVAATLDLSYRRLPEDQRRAYRLLGGWAAGDISASTAAALLSTDVFMAELLLEKLAEAHLLQEPAPGLYRMHVLARDHASQVTAREDGTAGRVIALSPHR
jgi:DNA-binding SARP family transcriptional activator